MLPAGGDGFAVDETFSRSVETMTDGLAVVAITADVAPASQRQQPHQPSLQEDGQKEEEQEWQRELHLKQAEIAMLCLERAMDDAKGLRVLSLSFVLLKALNEMCAQ